jgi:hypothetical protein
MSRFRSVYSLLTTPKFQALFSSYKPLRHKDGKDELGLEPGPAFLAGLFGGACHELPHASRRTTCRLPSTCRRIISVHPCDRNSGKPDSANSAARFGIEPTVSKAAHHPDELSADHNPADESTDDPMSHLACDGAVRQSRKPKPFRQDPRRQLGSIANRRL